MVLYLCRSLVRILLNIGGLMTEGSLRVDKKKLKVSTYQSLAKD
jgi:hypothetical protein